MDIIIMILLGWSVTFVPTTVGAAGRCYCWLLEDGSVVTCVRACMVVAVAVSVVAVVGGE
jgi:hypothetical protein